MTLDSNNHLTTVMMELIQEMWGISKEILSMLKETINNVSQHQDRLTCLQCQCPRLQRIVINLGESKHANRNGNAFIVEESIKRRMS